MPGAGATAGAGSKTWRAYLSTQAADGKPAINARDRIGRGPWQNFKGEVVAQNVDDLHSDNNKLDMQTSLTERGAIIPGVGYHPLVTTPSPGRRLMAALSRPGKIGPAATGRAAPRERRCWAISTERVCVTMRLRTHGIQSHPSRGPDGGCSQADLRSTGGDGLFYCFAAQ